jgi:hypothetical protein
MLLQQNYQNLSMMNSIKFFRRLSIAGNVYGSDEIQDK